MNTLKKLEKWKAQLEELNIQRIKAQSLVEQAMKELKAMGFDSVEEAAQEVERLEAEQEAAILAAEEFLTTLEERYAEFID